MTLIIGVSGRKNSGKDTVGKAFTNTYNKITETKSFISQCGPTKCRIYHYANKLKEFCQDYLSVEQRLLWGNNADKDTKISHLLWENMPGYREFLAQNDSLDAKISGKFQGVMTVREILQFFGTNVGRKMYPNIWVDSCLRQIFKDKPEVALILDERFISEADTVKKYGGYNVRLTRCPFPEDRHESEIVLDNYPFDHVIDNATLSLDETCLAFQNYVLSLIK